MPANGNDRPNLWRIRLLREEIGDKNRHPFSVPAIGSFEELELKSRVVFFVGENGSGKSTLLEAIAASVGFGLEGGSSGIAHRTRDDADPGRLADALRLTWKLKTRKGYFLRAESLFNIATYLDELTLEPLVGQKALEPYGGVSLHKMSHGESFLALFEHRFGGDGLYLFDEPEAALSTQRQLSLLVFLNDLLERTKQAQFIIATHSPILLAFPGAQIVSFDGDRLAEIPYRETTPYILTRAFLADPERSVARLLTDEKAEP